MQAAGVPQQVFSSSCSVYGTPDGDGVVTEGSATRPESPYGESKLISEWVLRDAAAVSDIRFVSLRYFNVAGAAAPEIADTGEFNLIPLALRALREQRKPQVFGGDYPTRDGSCIRDYIHVTDLADAHVAAVARLEAGPCAEIYNVGRGEGVTVLEVLDALRAVSGIEFEHEVVGRRPGDPAQVVACADKVRDDLGWTAQHDLHDMVRSAWEARRR
jgi:UDP-glucose 4-epimerase